MQRCSVEGCDNPIASKKTKTSAINITLDLFGMELQTLSDQSLTKARNVSSMAVIDVNKQVWDIALCTIKDFAEMERQDLQKVEMIMSPAMTNTGLNIEKLLKECFDENLSPEKLSTTSTLIRTIIHQTTSMCAPMKNISVSIGCLGEKSLDTFPTLLMLDISYSTERNMKLVSDSACYKMLGNGWTVDVIANIMSHFTGLTEEPVEVLSMYDGMSCGHIALDKLGAEITAYYATEIDKYAIQTTQHNFPDTVQLGDAFQVRDNNWGPVTDEEGNG